MKWGIIATGVMSDNFTRTLSKVEDAELYAVASRYLDKANEFKNKHGFSKAYGSYLEIIEDKDVEIVYVATPHVYHYEVTKMCIEHYKHVLCEKPFTINAKECLDIMDLAKKNNVFVAEAMWPRYMPSKRIITDLLNSNIIGETHTLTANLSFPMLTKKRILDKKLGGGALLDLGVYGLCFALTHFGKDIKDVKSSVHMTITGVDGQECINLEYNDGRIATLNHGMYCRSDCKGIIYGENGYIEVDYILNPQSIDVHDEDGKLIKHYDVPEQISGLEYEIIECMECIKNNILEAPSSPLSETLYLTQIMDSLRKEWGLKYPQE